MYFSVERFSRIGKAIELIRGRIKNIRTRFKRIYKWFLSSEKNTNKKRLQKFCKLLPPNNYSFIIYWLQLFYCDSSTLWLFMLILLFKCANNYPSYCLGEIRKGPNWSSLCAAKRVYSLWRHSNYSRNPSRSISSIIDYSRLRTASCV